MLEDESIVTEDTGIDLSHHKQAKISQEKYFATRYKCTDQLEEVFIVGDRVIIKKDFDNNLKTKKYKLESFYDGPYTIVQIFESNILLLKNENKEIKVDKKRCKKLN